jgi:hypothetical protein
MKFLDDKKKELLAKPLKVIVQYSLASFTEGEELVATNDGTILRGKTLISVSRWSSVTVVRSRSVGRSATEIR